MPTLLTSQAFPEFFRTLLGSEQGPIPLQVKHRYFLQSEDDLRDAPVKLPGGQLLHSVDPDVRSFYHRRLEIQAQNRIWVLKECLRQIGAAEINSAGILLYVARYYADTVERLRDLGAEAARDLEELEELRDTAKGVPCLDGTWHRATECIDGSDLFTLLTRQGWKQAEVRRLLCQLSHPRPVADTWSDEGKLSQTLWKVERLDRDLLAALAIQSESADLSFRTRTQVIRDNQKLVPEILPRRAVQVDKEVCAAIGGPTELQNLVVVEIDEGELGPDVLRAIVPEAADLRVISGDLTKGDVRTAAAVLRALGVPTVNSAAVAVRLTAQFVDIWRKLGSDARINLLCWWGAQKITLPPGALTLDIVLAGEGKGEWVRRDNVIAPRWANLSPPTLSATAIARSHGIPTEVLSLWDEWCGIRSLNTVVESMVRAMCGLPREKGPAASKQFISWIERLVKQEGAPAVAAALHNLPWVLACKGDEVEFRRASEVLDHPGAELLQKRFWVTREKIPAALSEFIQTRRLEGAAETLELIAQCLASAAHARAKAAENVYELLVELISDDVAADEWRRLASSQPVYRLFRSPDDVVSSEHLFLGLRDWTEDFGSVLYCFGGADDSKKRIRHLYRKLGVNNCPTAKQLVGALGRLSGGGRGGEVHSGLVDALTQVDVEDASLSTDDVRNVRLKSCAKTYEPVSRCYRDPELDRPSRVSAQCRERIVDGRDSANRKLLRWLDEQFPDTVLNLRATALAVLAAEPDRMVPGMSTVLDSWRDWLGELATFGSLVRDKVEQLGFELPSEPIRVEVVGKIDVQFFLQDGFAITPTREWPGPEVFHDSCDRLFVRSDVVDRDFTGQAADVERLDEKIADQLEDLLRKRAPVAGSPVPPPGSFRDAVRATLERPGSVLKRMREEKEEHFFHQYLDQTADPEFSTLFDEYRRTSEKAEEKRSSLAKRMRDLMGQRFVDTRRHQIRGYGYDEFAIFAELVQNAEDAYTQRKSLGMPDPPSSSMTFRYARDHEDRTLTASHYGRPFNMWRYGAKRIEAYRYDVEGVLKSAGSFKPHSQSEDERPIGRFGLGFKSVYLITDMPRIHSGDWHFEITAGCIPNEVPVPVGYQKDLTKIVLPLTPEASEEREEERGRYANLVPFLRQIDELRVEHSDGGLLDLGVTFKPVLHTSDGYVVQRVEIVGVQHVPGGTVRLLRARHPNHEAQLGVLLASDELPIAWTDAFDSDVFSVLPLRVRLGCGVGVSNLFEVQSGRTHLIDPVANKPRIAEAAKSLGAIAKALLTDDTRSLREVMTRFWSLWRWDRGDEEAADLRFRLAKELVGIAKTVAIIPTLDDTRCVKIGEEALFSFKSIPEDFANDLLKESVEFAVGAEHVKLHKGNVVPEPICSACERAFIAAGEADPIPIFGVGWSELGGVFLARPWLAERPELVSAMARSLPPGKIDEVRPWLSKCLFRAANGQQMQLADLLPGRFPGVHHLSDRLLDLLDESYDDDAVSLLKQVGLPSRPALDKVKGWLRSGLRCSECDGLLRYISEAGRWRRDYYDLGTLLNSPWFEADGVRLTTAEAFERGLVHLEELDFDPAFRAWLGIGLTDTDIAVVSDRDRWDRPVSDPKRALVAIYQWWMRERDRLVRRYEEQTYPGGKPPRLNPNFSDRDSLQRHRWLALLILASMHTMGRSKPEQHRGFLHQCERLGWMDVFAHPEFPADRWIGVLEEYLNTQTDDILFYHWVRQFVSIFQIARWLPDYAASFLAIDQFKERFALDRVIKPATSQDFSGGGPVAPPLTRTLGIGACFVVRELVRAGVLKSPLAYDHSYVAVGRVRYVFARLGMADLRNEGASYRHSPRIHNFLRDQLGADRAHYGRCFDLPFLAIAEDRELQRRFLECELPPEDEETP